MDENEAWKELLASDKRFTEETYRFMLEALPYAVFLSMATESGTEQDEEEEGAEFLAPSAADVEADSDSDQHVTGQDLCYAAAEYAVREYGFLAKDVLAQLGIRKTSDFGDVVYNMLRYGLMSKSDNDCREDFDDVFDLGEELKRLFKFNYSKKSR